MTSMSLEQIEAAAQLTPDEQAELERLEKVIAEGIRTFTETGRALRRVRDGRLYRATHDTFDAYARDKWDMRREVADRLVRAIDVVDAVAATNPVGLTPATERQARELAPLLDEPEKLVEVWESATRQAEARERPVTAEDVRAARQRLTEPHPAALPAAPVVVPPEPVDSNDLRFAHIEEAVQLLQMLPAPDQIVFPAEAGDIDAVDEAVEWLAKFTPQLTRAWKQHRATARRLRVV